MIVLFQILGRLKSGTAKDRYVADKNCTLAIPMQRVLNVEKEILLCSIRAETRAKSLVGEITFGGEKIQM